MYTQHCSKKLPAASGYENFMLERGTGFLLAEIICSKVSQPFGGCSIPAQSTTFSFLYFRWVLGEWPRCKITRKTFAELGFGHHMRKLCCFPVNMQLEEVRKLVHNA